MRKPKSRLDQRQDRGTDRYLYGSLGAASDVRKVELASIDAAALIRQLEGEQIRQQSNRVAERYPEATLVPGDGMV